MSFDISDYKLKHVVSLKEGLLERTYVEIPIEGITYSFRIDQVKSEVIELVDFYKYGEVKRALGSMEKKLKNFTYGKSRGDLNDHEVYEIRFSKFKGDVEGKTYEFEITGVGPSALKVSLFLKYNEIEKGETSLERKLKAIILDEYDDLLKDSRNQEKLKEMKKEYDEKQSEQDRIRDEVRREQAEKERKWRELEERLNANKPDKPFKF